MRDELRESESSERDDVSFEFYEFIFREWTSRKEGNRVSSIIIHFYAQVSEAGIS